jgi:Rps23 Pro-64 3,4-dihydroxylase Tpa1-like proline 4-hydroxylase
VFERLGGELLVLREATGELHTLNTTAAEVFLRCDGRASPAAIAVALGEIMGLPPSEEIVHLTMAQLVEAALVVPGGSATPEESADARELYLEAFGVHVRVIDRSPLRLVDWLQGECPPEWRVSRSGADAIELSVRGEASIDRRESLEYVIARGGEDVMRVSSPDALRHELLSSLAQTIAHRSRLFVFVRACVLLWRSRAVVIVGPRAGDRADLADALAAMGATTLSRRFCVIDDGGDVLPLEGTPASREPVPVALLVALDETRPAASGPEIVDGARLAALLVRHAIRLPGADLRVLRTVASVAREAVTLAAPPSDAQTTAAFLLDVIDSGAIHHALGDAPALASIAKARIQRRRAQASPAVVPARYVRLEGFLDVTEHQRLLDYVLSHDQDFEASGVQHADGTTEVDPTYRRSRTIFHPAEEVWQPFETRLRQLLPSVRGALQLDWFPISHIERQLTAHGPQGFFGAHTDSGTDALRGRRITAVYYFHAKPRGFSGGELRIYDATIDAGVATAASTYSMVEPVDNSIVFFASDTYHEVCPVDSISSALRHSRLAMNIWFWEGPWTPSAVDAASDAHVESRG